MEQPSQRIQPAHHEHHYKKSVIIAAVVIGVIVIVAIGYQLLTTDVGGKKEDKLRAEYYAEKVRASQESFKELEAHANDPFTDADKKAYEAFVKASASAPKTTPEESGQRYVELQQQSEQAFQEWKAAR